MTMSQLKKLILVGSVSCITLAGAHAPTTKNVCGVYVGANVGYNDLGGKYSMSNTLNDHPIANKSKHSQQGMSEGLFVGYNHHLDSSWFVGIQAGANYYNNQTDKSSFLIAEDAQFGSYSGVKFELERTWGYGVMLDVGYVFSPEVYSYIGIQTEYTTFKGKTYAVGGTQLFTSNKTKNILGWGPAVGVGYRLTKNIAIGAQWSTTFYPSTQFGYIKSTPRDNSFKLNVAYTF